MLLDGAARERERERENPPPSWLPRLTRKTGVTDFSVGVPPFPVNPLSAGAKTIPRDRNRVIKRPYIIHARRISRAGRGGGVNASARRAPPRLISEYFESHRQHERGMDTAGAALIPK